MNLTGKAEEAFWRWYLLIYYRCDTNGVPRSTFMGHNGVADFFKKQPVEKNAYFVEFFDSAGIYIQRFNSDGGKGREFDADVSFNGEMYFVYLGAKTRLGAVNKRIQKANEIYNNK